MASSTNIDDSDTRVSYAGGQWESIPDENQYQSAAHSTWDYDASATLQFSGTGVRVIGTIPKGKGKVTTTYQIDGGAVSTVIRDGGAQPVYGHEFYYSGPLSSGSHTIVIKNKGEDNDEDFRLDKFVVEAQAAVNKVAGGSGSSSTGTSSTADSKVTSTTSANSTGSHTPLPSASSTTAPSGGATSSSSGISTVTSSGGKETVTAANASERVGSSKSSPLPAILGVLLGAIGMLVLLAIIFCIRRRRRAHARELRQSAAVTPFNLPPVSPISVSQSPQSPYSLYSPSPLLSHPSMSQTSPLLFPAKSRPAVHLSLPPTAPPTAPFNSPNGLHDVPSYSHTFQNGYPLSPIPEKTPISPSIPYTPSTTRAPYPFDQATTTYNRTSVSATKRGSRSDEFDPEFERPPSYHPPS